MTGSYEDINALANITIAGWVQDNSLVECSVVKIMSGGKSVDPSNVKITSDNGAMHVTGLGDLVRAFHANLSISFI
jgi:hypothetical protein